MRYDKDTDKFEIELSEFVGTARRTSARIPVCDEEEPRAGELSQRLISRALSGEEAKEINFEFRAGGLTFLLRAGIDGYSAGRISVARAVKNAERPDKAELAEIRGEAFVLAHAILSETDEKEISVRLILASQESGELCEREERASRKTLSGFFEKCAAALVLPALHEKERVTVRLVTKDRLVLGRYKGFSFFTELLGLGFKPCDLLLQLLDLCLERPSLVHICLFGA